VTDLRVLFYDEETVDCTADPHYVSFDGLRQMYETILRVCEHPIVWRITVVTLKLNGEKFKSDFYVVPYTLEEVEEGKVAEGPYARRNKVEGLLFSSDAEVDSKHHLPIGLGGVRYAIRLILKELDRGRIPEGVLRIGVAWNFVKDHSCSDYITVKDLGVPEADFSNQDWWMEEESYPDHCKELSKVIGWEGAVTPSEEE